MTFVVVGHNFYYRRSASAKAVMYSFWFVRFSVCQWYSKTVDKISIKSLGMVGTEKRKQSIKFSGWSVYGSGVRNLNRVVLLSQRGRAMLCVRQLLASIVQYVERNRLSLVIYASDLPRRTNKFYSLRRIHWCVAICAVDRRAP